MSVEDVDERECAEVRAIMADWLKHPGTKLVTKQLRANGRKLLKEYDSLTELEELRRVQVARWFLRSELPRLVTVLANCGLPKQRQCWSFKDWIKKVCTGR